MEWISVEERLPDDGRDVLGSWGDLVDCCHYRPKGENSGWYSIKRGRYVLIPPKYWMPFPEPPKEQP